jgi:2-aminoadipate transaminase
MENWYARRMATVHKSFIREILKVTEDPSIISFAGGLPSPELFPVDPMRIAAEDVLRTAGKAALQYSTSEGFYPLREFISERYRLKKDLQISPDDIMITTGSQQGLDLTSKVALDPGDRVLVERPGYLGAIQAFSLFEPEFKAVELEDDGPDMEQLEEILSASDVKLFYAVPNFQNPSGRSYSFEKRERIADLLNGCKTVFVEDDPYGELRFLGEDLPSIYGFLRDRKILFGSFSKIAAPGFRLGWIVADEALRDKLIIPKQAADLHTSTFVQHVLYRYLTTNDIDDQIEQINTQYRKQRDLMVDMIEKYFPDEVSFTRPEGGMFLWVTLPEGFSSMALFDLAVDRKVAFVPGIPFYVDGSGDNTLRLNFSNSDEEGIREGIRSLGECLEEFLHGA